ncbi:STAS domain-containing protein [Asanoa sp. WMMD1127]|uniref:STAS domain-containing protein n=1 Tax=Asanoa sp. WMMD1127 TaxID=3016107 RepID=UPI002416BB6A|nr:STAS domain-containing protein [Asanoa sp. WMMD1127]MDG4824756.1 STAS domain-containing protein [Asanoa sp. WMMD1127]
MQFETRTFAEPGRTVVAVSGECDLTVRDQFTSVLVGAVDQAAVVVVDLADLRFMDSSGVHGLVVGHHAARDKGRRLYVVNAAGEVARVLALTGLADLLRPPLDGRVGVEDV